MRWLTLYLRSRRVPAALLGAGGLMALMWTLWSVSSDSRTASVAMVVLSVLLLVAALTATLAGPDDALEATAAFAWRPRRAAHLLAAFLVVAGLLLATLPTGAGFGPAALVVRDAAGLLGLTALGAATIGTARAWCLPLAWTLGAVLYPQDAAVAGRILTWPAQAPVSTAATVTAALLAIAGLGAYAVAGPSRRAPA
jgi:drug/metabolite transporter (DMT)-like permease